MGFKGIVTSVAAVALAATPVLANARTAPVQLAPAAETLEGSEAMDSSTVIVAVLALIAAGLGIWALADGGDKGVTAPPPPVSP